MAEADPLLDEDLNEGDRRTVDAIESPIAQTGDGPDPNDLDEIQAVLTGKTNTKGAT